MAARFLFLEGLSELAKSKGKQAEFEKEFGGKSMAQLYPYSTSSYHQKITNSKFLTPDSFLPGDRVWMKNHRFRSGLDPVGNEGSNVIYLGRGKSGAHLFLHMDGGYIETFDELRETVRSYSRSTRQDGNIENYKFEERYIPLIPHCIR